VYPKKLFSSRSSTYIPRPSQYLVTSINDCPKKEFDGLSDNTKKLLRMGVTYKEATNALLLHQNDLLAACNSIHDKIVDEVNRNPYHSHLNLFVPRIALRIKSWLPNLQSESSDQANISHQNNSNKDFFTGYVLNVSFTDSDDSMQSWQLTYRYQRFRSFCDIVYKHGSHVPIAAPFPYATAIQTLFGIDDTVRTERMDALDRWLREVVLNPCLMTILPISIALFDFLQVDTHLKKGKR